MKTVFYPEATEEALLHSAALIREGELVAFPTETVYGLGADATNGRAVEKIYEAKGRESDNPLIVHFADAEDICAYAVIEDERLFSRLCAAFWPGPLTLVLKRREALSPRVSAGLSTVAVRVPSHPVARAFIRACGCPIAAPSANRSHRPSPTSALHVREDLDGKIAAILSGGICQHGVESTVLSLSEPLRLLRPGAVTREMIERVAERDVCVDAGVLSRVEDCKKVSSPGMKYRHYAPRAPLCAVVGKDEAVRAFLFKRWEEGCGVLCYEEDLAVLSQSARVKVLGKAGDYETQAQRLFSLLRQFDEMQDVAKIYTRLPEGEGVGLAVKNRLLRACEFDLIEVTV